MSNKKGGTEDPDVAPEEETEPELSTVEWLRTTGLANQHSSGRPFGK
jgi:hypothetical protein